MTPASWVVLKSVSFHAVEKQYATNSIDKAFKSGTITEQDVVRMREFVVEKCRQFAVINPPVSRHCPNCGMPLADDNFASDKHDAGTCVC